MNNKQYILRNKMTGRYLHSNFDDMYFNTFVVDIKELNFANIFSEKEINELKSGIFNKFNINDYIITTKDIEIRRLKLKDINLRNRFEDYIGNNLFKY